MPNRVASLALAVSLLSVPAAADIETVFTFGPETPPGNIAIGPDGRMFMSVHEFYGKELRVVEVMRDGTTKPYPTETWARAPEGDGPGLRGVLGLRVDRQGILWMLDGQGDGHAGRLVGWDTNSEQLSRIITLAPPVTRPNSFLNDIAVDRDNGAIYVADTGGPDTSALIVVDLTTGRARRVLEGSRFTVSEDADMVIDGRVVTLGDAPARIGVNPITVDPTNSWVYFAPMSGTSLYRVPTGALRDESLSSADLEAAVERYGDKTISDGSTVDAAGNVYITSITDDSIGVTRPDGSYSTLHKDDSISWPDGFAIGPDGFVYVTVNELHRSPPLNGGTDGTQGEFAIMRFKPLGDGINGR